MKNAVFWDVAPYGCIIKPHGATSQKMAFFMKKLFGKEG
jgi:hypothetical protein